MDFYQSTACHVCKTVNHELKRCSGCKLFAYCSKDHQKIHWNDHKVFCKMVKTLLTSAGGKHHMFQIKNIAEKNSEEWVQMRIDLKELWEISLRRQLTDIENQLWMFPRVCEICYESRQDKLVDCPMCFSASYCSSEHQLEHTNYHEPFCESLRQCFEINRYLFDGHSYPLIDYNLQPALKQLPKDIDTFVKEFMTVNEITEFSDILSTETMSPILTIAYALEKCGHVKDRIFMKNTQIKEKLVVHIVGASLYEGTRPWHGLCAFLIEWIENLEDLLMILIGTDMKKQVPPFSREHNGIKFTVMVVKQLYHDYANSETAVTPDIIVAFNCGLHEFQDTDNDTWSLSIDSFFQYQNIPIVLTCYTKEEAQMDIGRLKITERDNCQILVNCQKNPFRSLRPMRNWETPDSPVFYQNNYIIIVKTS